MTAEVDFYCDFCANKITPDDNGWTFSRKPGPLTTYLSDEEWHQKLESNLGGPHICTNCALTIVHGGGMRLELSQDCNIQEDPVKASEIIQKVPETGDSI